MSRMYDHETIDDRNLFYAPKDDGGSETKPIASYRLAWI